MNFHLILMMKIKHKQTKIHQAIESELSVETFTTLSYTLRAILDFIKFLLDEKRFACVLLGKIYSNPIEMCFCKMRGMLGMDMELNAESFCPNYCSYFLRQIASLSKKYRGTFSRN